MCGIAGFLGADLSDAAATLGRMTNMIAHRGPDDEGAWVDQEAGVALGHRRLSIIDLSAAGHQPMRSPSGRYVLVYNGEIYTHRELRAELDGMGGGNAWRGHSDTEVLVAAFDQWGITGALERVNGMFAFGVWDRSRRVLVLARDRTGEKPLFYGRMNNDFLFGSELKALTAHPAFRRDIDREALTSFLRYSYVPAPRSIWQGISKLRPGHYVEISDAGRTVGTPVCYWNLEQVITEGSANPLADTPERVDELQALLLDAVGRRLEADVPVGAFLSGGIDSTLIVALMQARSTRPARTFTIGFDEQLANEAEHAKQIAAHLGTDHTELYVTADDALELLPRLPQIWDEPFADSSQLPTFLVSEMTRRHVTVALSGDGGDEVFGGYNRYHIAADLWSKGARMPAVARKLLAGLARSSTTIAAADWMMRRVPPKFRHLGIGDRLPKIGHVMEASSQDDLYLRLTSHFQNPSEWVIGGSEEKGGGGLGGAGVADFRSRMMYADTLGYLADDSLVKVDRASMAVSLETRVPFLDHRVIEYAWRLPLSAKFAGGKGKHILRQLLDRYIPRHLIDRPKMGFGVPLGVWLHGPLKGWANDLLAPDRLKRQGFFNVEAVTDLWQREQEHGLQHYHVWDLLMFQAWWEHHGTAAGPVNPPLRELAHA